jgi:hypothetical protein
MTGKRCIIQCTIVLIIYGLFMWYMVKYGSLFEDHQCEVTQQEVASIKQAVMIQYKNYTQVKFLSEDNSMLITGGQIVGCYEEPLPCFSKCHGQGVE